MKFDVTALKDARKENTYKRELIVASLQNQIHAAISQYLTDLSNDVPAGAEKLALTLGVISINEDILTLSINNQFIGQSIRLSRPNSSRAISLCKLEGDAQLISHGDEAEVFHGTGIKILDKPVKISNDLSLFYKDIIGEIPLTELWGENIPEAFSIDLV